MASATEIGSGKTVIILSLVIGCFGVLWPKIFYPMLQASISSSAEAPYSEVSGVYHSSVLPCCHPVTFTKELNALYFTELCQRLQWRAGHPPDHQSSERKLDLWTPGLARWCSGELRRTCGVQLTEPALERYRRAAGESDAATRNLSHCLETSYDVRREDIRPSRHHLTTGSKFPAQERQAHAAAAPPHAAAAAAHAHVQNMARQPRRIVDGGPRPMRGMRSHVAGGLVQPQPKGSGAMGIIMPIYTIGIVVFFMYTIMRVMFKKNEKSGSPAADSGVRRPPSGVDSSGRPHQSHPTEPAEGRSRVQTVLPSVRRESPVTRQTAVGTDAAPTPAQWRRPTDGECADCVADEEVTAPPAAAQRASGKAADSGEIDQLRRRLEETERVMERIMKQMSSVSHKLNAAKISTNIRALKQELWGSVDSLASESCATDYSLDSRAQVLTDPSLYTYSLDSYGAGGGMYSYSLGTSCGAPSAYSLDTTDANALTAPRGVQHTSQDTAADDTVASAVSRLYRSVSQLSLELETAPAAEDELSMPAETGAELSELPEADDEIVDGVDELRHDGENGVRRFASLEALQQSRAAARAAGGGAEEEATTPQPQVNTTPLQATGEDDRTGVKDGHGQPPAAGAETGPAATGISAAGVMAGEKASVTSPPATVDLKTPLPPPTDETADSVPDAVSELRAATCPHSFPSGLASPSTDSSLRSPRVIVLGLRTKRTPEREPARSVSFRVGGAAPQVLGSSAADGAAPQSAVLVRETETRASRESGAELETKLELQIAGMEVTPAPPRSTWAARLHSATEASLASIEEDLRKAAQALKNVSKRTPVPSSGKESKKTAPARNQERDS